MDDVISRIKRMAISFGFEEPEGSTDELFVALLLSQAERACGADRALEEYKAEVERLAPDVAKQIDDSRTCVGPDSEPEATEEEPAPYTALEDAKAELG